SNTFPGLGPYETQMILALDFENPRTFSQYSLVCKDWKIVVEKYVSEKLKQLCNTIFEDLALIQQKVPDPDHHSSELQWREVQPQCTRVVDLLSLINTHAKSQLVFLSSEEKLASIALRASAIYGNDQLVQSVIEKLPHLQRQLLAALKDASFYGQYQTVHKLLHENNISNDDRGWAVRYAALSGHIKIVQMLLHENNISNDVHGLAVQHAALNGHTKMVQMLLNYRLIPQENLLQDSFAQAIHAAAVYSHSETLHYLLTHHSNSSRTDIDKLYSKAISTATAYGHRELVSEIIALEYNERDFCSHVFC
ncbi:MAG: ankyrin repeat domain-containing protein, partial [Rhabdochlamydiaceae bacterium]|nr:ankyrin repeat domain-containing protein [Rhabdochlamydiaceae bacterium]